MIVATLLEPDLEGLRDAVRTVPADAFEIRLDALREPVDPCRLRELTPKPLIATLRRGAHAAGISKHRDVEEFLQADLDFVDFGTGARSGPRIVRSHHHWKKTPSAGSIVALAERTPPTNVFKFASRVNSFDDSLRLLVAARDLQRRRRRFAVMGMGDFPRAVAALFGTTFTYGGGRTCAPGQPPASSLRATLAGWGHPEPQPSTYLVVGAPVAHSRSPRIHNAAFRRLRVESNYGALEVARPRDLKRLFRRASSMGLAGLSVTAPLKEAANRLVGHLDPRAKASGSVNCVRFGPRTSRGSDTDGPSAKALLDRVAMGSENILVLGTGGSARAVASALADRRVTIAGRDERKTKRIAAQLGVEGVPLRDTPIPRFDVVVNATSVLEPKPLGRFAGVTYDLHYGDRPTPWSDRAARLRTPFISGLDHLVEQAHRSLSFWLGRTIPRARLRAAAETTP